MFSNRNIFIATVALLAGFMQILYPIPSPVPTNQVFMVLAAFLIIVLGQKGGMTFHYASVVFLLTIAISIMANNIPYFFKPWSRYFQFVFLFIAASPMISGKMADRAKRNMTMGALWSCVFITMLSFLGYFGGFGKYMSGFVQSYMGVTGHANFLGMYAMVAMVWFAALFFRGTNMKEYAIIATAWVACLITLLLSASRGATAAGLLGSLIVIYMRLKESATNMMTAVAVGIGLIIFASPYLATYMETMTQKGIDADNMDSSVAATRGYIWELRFMEHEKSPIVGIGSYSCDITLQWADTFYNADNGNIELGSSYLGLLSQQGYLGLVCFLILALPIIWKTFKFANKQGTPYAQLMLGLLVAIACHMAFEGYLLTAGAVQSLIWWFVLGAAYQCDTVADYPVFWEKSDPITPEQFVAWKENHK
ncbi:MAG: O-antigen ligase family protein [Bacteroidales bacterium]|nr:O-antigen ligase family protein [Bacteroidales bacterium]